MRLFTGLDLAPDVLARIASFVEELKPQAPLQWSSIDNLHVTTKFIGEWPEARLDELKGKLSITQKSFWVTVEGLGFFPHARSPRILWAGIAQNKDLFALAAATETALLSLGIQKEERPYSPHLTLARIPVPGPLDDLLSGVPETFGSFEVRAFHLYLSRNSAYTKLGSFALE